MSDPAFLARPSLINNGLAGYWPLEENTTGTRYDATANGNNLSASNAPAAIQGKQGLAAAFNPGSSQWLQCPDATVLRSGNNDQTVTCWVLLNVNNNSFNYGFISKVNATSGNSDYALLFLASSQRYSFARYVATDTSKIASATTFGLPPTNTWHFVAGWYIAASNTVYISVNAGASNTVATGGALQTAGNAPLVIGQHVGGNFMNGIIDEPMIWNRALNQAEITQLYTSGLGTHGSRFTGSAYNIDTNWTTARLTTTGAAGSAIHGWQGSGVVAGLSDKIFAAFCGTDNTNYVATRTISTGVWGSPVALGSFHGGDADHSYASLAVDTNGYIHALYGCHDTPMYYRRSSTTNSAATWLAETNIASISSYPALIIDQSNVLYGFYRSGAGGADTVRYLDMITSTNSGTNWSAATHIIDSGTSNVWTYHGGFGQGNEAPQNSMHVIWSWRGGNQLVNDATEYTNIYYAKTLDGGVTWKKADGTTYTLPITTNTAELVYASASVLPSSIALDTNNLPTIGFMHANGTNYWTDSTAIISRWNGSVWSTQTLPGDNYFHQVQLYCSSNNVLRALCPRPVFGGFNQMINHTLVSGSNWNTTQLPFWSFSAQKCAVMPRTAQQTTIDIIWGDTSNSVLCGQRAME